MPTLQRNVPLAATGSTGNNTHTSVPLEPLADFFSVAFIVEAIGATPTVTWKVQVSMDAPSVSDANSTWVDLNYVTDSSDTPSTAARTATAVGQQYESLAYVAAAANRVWRKIRLVTSLNTNVTYRGEVALFRNSR